jgi:NhaP-type Na+/H+ or K+/H+ antiporter
VTLSPTTALVAIVLAGAVCQVLAWRVRLPAILFLLLAGILLGPVSGWLHPDALFGELLFPVVSLAVAVILFEGSLTLRLEDIRGHGIVVRRMVGVGSLISATVAGLAAHFFAGFGWELAALFGALMTVTGPTVVVPMLRTIRPARAVAHVLRWEGIVIDPLGALFTVLVFEFIVATSGGDVVHVLVLFGSIIGVGVLSGLAAGYLLGTVLRRHWLPEYLINIVTLNLVIAVFAVANALAEESGLLAVTVMGILMANMRDVPVSQILNFKETLSILLVSALFVILAARIDPAVFQRLGWGAAAVFMVMQFFGRPLKVAVATLGSSLSWQERALIAWIGPRGIVAAAIAALFALRLEAAGVPQADLMVPLVFTIIIATVVVQGATARVLAGWLGVAEPEPCGFLVVGANPLARAIGCELKQLGYDVLLADSSRDNVRAARMAGLPTFYGNPVSEHADRRLDLVGIGRLLGLSPDPDQNALAALRYRSEFGPGEVYGIQSSVDVEGEQRRALSRQFRGRILFGEEVSYAQLAEMLKSGAEVRTTRLSDTFDYQDFVRKHWKRVVVLFAVTPKGQLRVSVAGEQLEPGPGWKLVALVQPSAPANSAGGETKVTEGLASGDGDTIDAGD